MDQYRVYGNPINQSRSPYIHHQFAQQTVQDIDYQSELVEMDAFTHTVQRFIESGGKGANVTLPFKEQAMQLCDQLTERAKLAGAVNTLSFLNGKIYGDNTDGVGLVKDLIAQQVVIKNKRILLLGAGGAARGVILPLLEQAPQSITIANRTVSKAEQLSRQFNDARTNFCGFEQLGDQSFDIVINATSASLSGSIPAISAKVITADTVCYDMVYGKSITPFMTWAKQRGANQVIDGLGMLVGQAAESFFIWRNVVPETEPVMQSLRKAISQ
jgi:shikimate dehydrogenase